MTRCPSVTEMQGHLHILLSEGFRFVLHLGIQCRGIVVVFKKVVAQRNGNGSFDIFTGKASRNTVRLQVRLVGA